MVPTRCPHAGHVADVARLVVRLRTGDAGCNHTPDVTNATYPCAPAIDGREREGHPPGFRAFNGVRTVSEIKDLEGWPDAANEFEPRKSGPHGRPVPPKGATRKFLPDVAPTRSKSRTKPARPAFEYRGEGALTLTDEDKKAMAELCAKLGADGWILTSSFPLLINPDGLTAAVQLFFARLKQ